MSTDKPIHPTVLRHRHPTTQNLNLNQISHSQPSTSPQSTFGSTPDGKLFKIPETHDVLSSLFDPRLPKSHLDLITLASLSFQLFLLPIFSFSSLRSVYLTFFIFWRLAYNAGLGWVLKRQSERRYIVRFVTSYRLFDPLVHPMLAKWVEAQLTAKMAHSSTYAFTSVPIEYNVWLIFRQLVDIVLLNDFLAYFLFCLTSTRPPLLTGLLRITAGVALVVFNVWVKLEAHRVIHDYAWYWGDAFFRSLHTLVFDGVFEMAPHPMYSIGYAGFYGASLITGSPLVFFVSLGAHLCQFGFLLYFENPHIERTYGRPKPLTARDPIPVKVQPLVTTDERTSCPTPSLTTGQSGAEWSEDPDGSLAGTTGPGSEPDEIQAFATHAAGLFKHQQPSSSSPPQRRRARPLTRQDLEHRLFRKEMLGLQNFDPLRATDLATVLGVLYGLGLMVLPANRSISSQRALVVLNALVARLCHSFGLGLLLRKQSDQKWLVRHFLKRYHYPKVEAEDGVEIGGKVVEDCFSHWKGIYNLSLIMIYVSFGALAWQFYELPANWSLGSELLRHTFGLCLIGLHVWTACSTYEVLGNFGWFYGDFFIDEYPNELAYTGIYRFLNNPERTMGGAGLIGMSLMSGSMTVFGFGMFSMVCHWWFLSFVETPHMKKLYGDAIRKEAGLTKTLRQKAMVRLKKTPAVRIEEKIKEVQGTFEHIYDETVIALDDFLEKSAPRLSGVVRDTKVLLQQSGERLILTRVANNLSSYDTTQYHLKVHESTYHEPYASVGVEEANGQRFGPTTPTSTPRLKFHVGEPITLTWMAPGNHSRSDWIGLYRCGSNTSRLVTRVVSLGRWLPVCAEEWEGDLHVGKAESGRGEGEEPSSLVAVKGTVSFTGPQLAWSEGWYEFRYHHDGKHNVMAITEPIEIYVEKVSSDENRLDVIQASLRTLVGYSLCMNPKLIPKSLKPQKDKTEKEEDEGDEDEDDFVVMDQEEAKRIRDGIRKVFGVELGVEVVVADGNVMSLALRILGARKLLRPILGVSSGGIGVGS